MLMPGGFQKFAGIPTGISRIFESLMVQQISANRRKNRSIQVLNGFFFICLFKSFILLSYILCRLLRLYN
jgi:hypothetical protein